MPIITISRQFGSLGPEIAKKVVRQLDYKLVDKSTIEDTMTQSGYSVKEVEEGDEKRPGFLSAFSRERKKFIHLLEAVIFEHAAKENVLIIGRGGQVLLKDVPGALHVRIHAPLEIRIDRVCEREGFDRKRAERLCVHHDKDSAGFIRNIADREWEDPDLYDLQINTGKLSVDSAAKLIVDAVNSAELEELGKENETKLADMALAHRVEAKLLFLNYGYPSSIFVEVEAGVAVLTGTVTSAREKAECQDEIAAVQGVKRVRNEILVVKSREAYF